MLRINYTINSIGVQIRKISPRINTNNDKNDHNNNDLAKLCSNNQFTLDSSCDSRENFRLEIPEPCLKAIANMHPLLCKFSFSFKSNSFYLLILHTRN